GDDGVEEHLQRVRALRGIGEVAHRERAGELLRRQVVGGVGRDGTGRAGRVVGERHAWVSRWAGRKEHLPRPRLRSPGVTDARREPRGLSAGGTQNVDPARHQGSERPPGPTGKVPAGARGRQRVSGSAGQRASRSVTTWNGRSRSPTVLPSTPVTADGATT